MKIAIIEDELYPFFFTSTSEVWEGYQRELPEDFDYEDYVTTCKKWNEYQHRLEKILDKK